MDEKLTATERFVVTTILKEARRCLIYDSDRQEYVDDGSFLLLLDKEELAALARALKKI